MYKLFSNCVKQTEELKRSKLKVYLNVKVNQINDPLKKARDVENIGHYSSGDTEITIKDINAIRILFTVFYLVYSARPFETR